MSNYELYHREVGKGEPVVLLHGMLGSSRYWSQVANELSATNRVISLDLLGFGESPKPRDAEYSLLEHATSIVNSLKRIGLDEPYTLGGHSMGSLIALNLAADYQDQIKKLTLFNLPVYKSPEEARSQIVESGIVSRYMVYGSMARFACALMCTFRPIAASIAPAYRRELPKEVAQDSVKHTWQSYSRSMANVIENQDAESDLRKLTMPTTVIYGESDALVSSGSVTDLENLNPKIKVIIEKGSHHLPLENPTFVADQLKS